MLRSVLLVLALTLAAPASAVTFKIATLAPDGTSWMQALRAGAAEVEKRTAGRAQFRFFPGGVMGNDNSVLRKIRVGQLHGGALTGGGAAEIYRDANVYSVPFLFQSFAEVDYVRERMDPVLLQGMRDNGFISFGISEGGFAYLMSDRPIRTMAELKTQKVWIPEGDRISRVGLETVGVAPIPLPLSDVLTSLQTGMVNTVAASLSGAIALQWHTRVKYVTDVPLMYLYGTMVVSRKAFEQLSAADQAVVSEVMGRVFRELDRQNRADNERARQALRSQGITFVELAPSERRNWFGVVTSAVERLGREGVFTPALLQREQGHLDEYRRGAASR